MLYRDFCINFGILLTFLPITETCRENQIALTRYYVNNLMLFSIHWNNIFKIIVLPISHVIHETSLL